jgi:hypothetical protein
MLLGVRNRDEPTLSPRHPQLISGAEIGWRIIERAGPYLNFISAIDDRKDGRPAHGTEVAIVSRKLPASSLTSDRHVARLPNSEEVAERPSLLPADFAVAKADPHRPPVDLKLHLPAVAATRSLEHGTSTVGPHCGQRTPSHVAIGNRPMPKEWGRRTVQGPRRSPTPTKLKSWRGGPKPAGRS